MKISAKQYAESLFSSLESKSKKETEDIVSRFLSVLVENGDRKMFNDIVLNFEKTWNEKNNIKNIEVTSAKELNKASEKKIKDFSIKKLGSENIEIKKNIDKNILGGVIIKDGDKVYDGSVRTRLYELKNRLNK
ncbi:ATP synthase F1 subunit delta [Candidatus Parcubacteria bacterium]|nr:MAG: ATP synthase F1 subunit delta [Candidatus Parcubacteria bacterium]